MISELKAQLFVCVISTSATPQRLPWAHGGAETRHHHMVRTPVRLLVLACAGAFVLASPAWAVDDTDAAAEHLLAAETALKDRDYLRVSGEYRKAAAASESVEVAREATLVSFNFGFQDDALASAQRWLQLEPDSDQALFFVARLELREGDVRAARRHFKKLIERGEEPADERLFSLMQVMGEEDAKDADKLMRALAKPYPNSKYANYAAAAMALAAEDVVYAKERAARAIELDPEWLQPKLLYARALLLSGEQEKAIDYTARIIGDDPDPDPNARMELAIMMMSEGRDDDALSQVNQVLLENPSRIDALRLMAIINFRQQNFDAAWDDFEDLLASGRYTMDALYYLARIADFRDQTDRAVRLYAQVNQGQHALTSRRRASALLAFQNDDPDRAMELLDDFAEKNPEFAIDMVLARAQLLQSLERYDEALLEYDRFVAYRPDSEGAILGRAELLLRMDRLEDAILEYREAVRRWPDSAMSLNALGYTLADRTEEYREAEKLIVKALKLNPDSPAIIDSHGWVLYRLGRHEEALAELERAYEGLPDPEVAAHIVEVLAALDRRDEALAFLETAESKTPDNELLRDVRERVFPDTP